MDLHRFQFAHLAGIAATPMKAPGFTSASVAGMTSTKSALGLSEPSDPRLRACARQLRRPARRFRSSRARRRQACSGRAPLLQQRRNGEERKAQRVMATSGRSVCVNTNLARQPCLAARLSRPHRGSITRTVLFILARTAADDPSFETAESAPNCARPAGVRARAVSPRRYRPFCVSTRNGWAG